MLLTTLALLAALQPSTLQENNVPANHAMKTPAGDDPKARCEAHRKEALERNAARTNEKSKPMWASAIEQSYQNCLEAAAARGKN